MSPKAQFDTGISRKEAAAENNLFFRDTYLSGRNQAFDIFQDLLIKHSDSKTDLISRSTEQTDQLVQDLTPEEIEDFISNQIVDETAQNAARLCLLSLKILQLSRYRAKYGHDRTLNSVKDSLICFNRSLREAILDADGTSYKPQTLVSYLHQFVAENGVFHEPKEEIAFGQEVMSTIVGVWYEQTFTNACKAGDVSCEGTTINQDIDGIDVFVATNSSGEQFVPCDIKASLEGAIKQAEKYGTGKPIEIHEFSAQNGHNIVNRYGSRTMGSESAPVIYAIFTHDRCIIKIDVGLERGIPTSLESTRFSPYNGKATEPILLMRSYLGKTCANGFKTFKRDPETGNFTDSRTTAKRNLGRRVLINN